jgi:hypothetical protein
VSIPFGTKLVQLARAVCAGERSCELCDDVVFTFQDDPSRPVCVSHHAVADFESGTAESFSGNRDLILGTDPGRTPSSFLYVRHDSKGSAVAYIRQEDSDICARRPGFAAVVTDDGYELIVARPAVKPRCRRPG